MCVVVDREPCGELWDLCPDHVGCLADGNPYQLSSVARRAFGDFDAKSAVIEREYFDIDFRSEFASKHETIFASSSVDVWRYHLFSERIDAEVLGAAGPKMRDFVDQNRNKYLGYLTLRPAVPATVGRSIIPFRLTRQPALQEPRSPDGYVRTAVTEHLNLFGVALAATGVPFMEQDGALLLCSHVASWMTHYSAVLKGWVGRRPSAVFATDSYDLQSFGRNYPALGASTLVQSQLLRRVGLPPEYVEPAAYFQPRESLEWFDRPGFERALRAAEEEADVEMLWFKESLANALSQYLNSGIPCIFNTDDHSFVICGYYRYRDLDFAFSAVGDAADQPAQSLTDDPEEQFVRPNLLALDDVTAIAGFIVHDDQLRPYRLITLDSLADFVRTMEADCSVVIPLPAGLWLSSTLAQGLGAQMLSGLIEQRLGALQTQGPDASDVPPNTISVLAEIDSAIKTGRPSEYFLRTYATQGVDFKSDFARRVNGDNAARVAGYTHMPKYVWVVELIERKAHAAGDPAVRATVVLDATTAAPETEVSPAVLMAHLPGQVANAAPGLQNPGTWLPTHTDLYESGRWHTDQDSLHGGQVAVSQHFKTATM